jgi:hypothetical protein
MKAGVIIGSALAGAAAAAVLTLDKNEKEKVKDFLGDVKDKVVDLKDKVVDLAGDLKDKLPGRVQDVVPEALGAVGLGAKASKGRGTGVGNSKPAQAVKGMKGGRAKAAKTGRKSGR